MNAVVFKANGRSGDYIKATLVPANRSEEPHFTVADGAAAGTLLAIAGGVICLLLRALAG
jgi:hypothetical protein